MRFLLICILLSVLSVASAQVDTINTDNLKLNIAALKTHKASYAVYFTDTVGKRTTSADVWDREISIDNNNRTFTFIWDWYRKDTLVNHVVAKGMLPSLKMINHITSHYARGRFVYDFNNGVVTVPDSAKRTAKDSALHVTLDPAGLEFPMDLEIFPLLPFKKLGQEFAVAFYEPRSPKAAYYKVTVDGKEDLELPGGEKLKCWIMTIHYGRGTWATFWIADKVREVVKMKEYYGKGYRYKVKLF